MVKKTAKTEPVDPMAEAAEKMMAVVESFGRWLEENEESFDIPPQLLMDFISGHCQVLKATVNAAALLTDEAEED